MLSALPGAGRPPQAPSAMTAHPRPRSTSPTPPTSIPIRRRPRSITWRRSTASRRRWHRAHPSPISISAAATASPSCCWLLPIRVPLHRRRHQSRAYCDRHGAGEAGGIDNVRLIEGGFEDWRDPRSARLRLRHDARCLCLDQRGGARRRVRSSPVARLKPGGLLYVSYNAYPGWGAVAPLRQFLLDYASGSPATSWPMSPRRSATCSCCATRAPPISRRIRAPASCSTTSRARTSAMSRTRSSCRIGRRNPSRRSRSGCARPALPLSAAPRWGRTTRGPRSRLEFLPLLLKEKDRERAELYRDYINNTFFRRDVFARMPSDAPRHEVTKRLEGVAFGTSVPLGDLARAIPLPDGEMPLVGEPYDGLRRAIANGTKSSPSSSAHRLPRAQARGGRAGAAVSGDRQPGRTVRPCDERGDAARGLGASRSRSIADCSPSRSIAMLRSMLMSPMRGCAVVVPRGDALVLLAVAEAPDRAADWAWDYAASRQAWLATKAPRPPAGRPIAPHSPRRGGRLSARGSKAHRARGRRAALIALSRSLRRDRRGRRRRAEALEQFGLAAFARPRFACLTWPNPRMRSGIRASATAVAWFAGGKTGEDLLDQRLVLGNEPALGAPLLAVAEDVERCSTQALELGQHRECAAASRARSCVSADCPVRASRSASSGGARWKFSVKSPSNCALSRLRNAPSV